jgi:hypothetical protein
MYYKYLKYINKIDIWYGPDAIGTVIAKKLRKKKDFSIMQILKKTFPPEPRLRENVSVYL